MINNYDLLEHFRGVLWGETTFHWGRNDFGWGRNDWGETTWGQNDRNSLYLAESESQREMLNMLQSKHLDFQTVKQKRIMEYVTFKSVLKN